MRWTYLITRLLIVALVWGFVAFGMDPLLRYTAVQALQSAIGAKADVAVVTTKFFPPTVTIRNVALASARRPGKNLVEFDELHVRLEPSSLSRRRFVVEEGHLTGLRFDTRRADDGQLEASPEPISEEPSWMSERLTELGTEWLTDLTQQVKAQLDPNVLETYRTGTEMYEKWDARFVDMVSRGKDLEPRVRQLKIQFEQAKKGDPLQQIEQYILVAERAEQIVIEVQGFREELKSIVPEVRSDFQTLNEARIRDQEKVQHTLALLKPDARRITQALLGKTMYRQIQQILTWVEAVRDYQKDLKEQVRPPRSVGRDFEFLVRNPAPDFLLKSLSLSGEISINEELIPFLATISDVTEDPRLLGRPCQMHLTADGSRPLKLQLTWDATGDTPVARMLADYRDTNAIPLLAGKPGDACFRGTLSDLAWTSRLTVMKDQISGSIDLNSRIGHLMFEASEDVREEVVEAANEAISAIQTLNASVDLGGTLRDPEIRLQSDVGEQVSSGVQLAFVHQLDRAKARLVSEVNTYAADQIEKLKGRFSGEYEKLMNENKDLLEQVGEIRTLVATLKSGKADPATIVRQVTNSRLIPEKEGEKIRRVMGDVDTVLNRQGLPVLLQERLQKEASKIPQLPQIPGGFRQFLPQPPARLPISEQ